LSGRSREAKEADSESRLLHPTAKATLDDRLTPERNYFDDALAARGFAESLFSK
jgi:hypothetical protein